MDRLTETGFECYMVGGCVRDALLNKQPQDYDLCTNALPREICEVFKDHSLVRSGEKHGTIGVVMDKQVYEITTFRTEGGYTDSRHPDWVKFVPAIEEDLARRDFTVNAMAYHPQRGLVDPWGGRQDLKEKCLRTVGDPKKRFTEDPLRILRGVRFSVRYDLTPEKHTETAMLSMTDLMDNLARERVFDELCKLLPTVKARDLIRFAPVITQVIPELASCVGFDQQNPHHAYDIYTHTAHTVEAVPETSALRWAALLHDIGKPQAFSKDEAGIGHFYGHEEESAKIANEVLLRLKAPNALREQVAFLVEAHGLPLPADKKVLRRRLSKFGRENIENLLLLQMADRSGTGIPRADMESLQEAQAVLEELLREEGCLQIRDLAVNGEDLIQLGIPAGPQLGQTLNHLLDMVLEEKLPNETHALLAEAKKNM